MDVDFINDPKDPVHLDAMRCREGAQMAVSSQENAARMRFGQDECKAVVNRQLRGTAHNLLRPQDTFAGQVYYLEATPNERPLLGACEL